MYHAAAQYFYPAGMLANIAAFSMTYQTINIHFCARFCKWKIRRAKTDLHFFAKHFLHKKIQRLFKIGKAYIFINIQPLHLVKKTMRPGTNGFVAVNTARANYTDGWLLVFHHPCLYVARMRTQEPVWVFLHIKSILHIPRRMVFGHIHRSEIVPVVFNLRAFCQYKTKPVKNRNDTVAYQA